MILRTEKTQANREIEMHQISFNKLTKECKELRESQETMIDEVTKVNKQNGEYRSLVLDNESQIQNA